MTMLLVAYALFLVLVAVYYLTNENNGRPHPLDRWIFNIRASKINVIKYLFCKHIETKYIEEKISESKFSEKGNIWYECTNCYYREYGGTYGKTFADNEAIKFLYEVLARYDLDKKYGSGNLYQEYGSYIYCEFRQELSSIYSSDDQAKAERYIKNVFGLKDR